MVRFATGLFSLVLLSAPAAYAGGDFDFSAHLRGSNEVPPISTDTRGRATFEVDHDYASIEFKMTVRTHGGVGLLAVAGAHIHCAPAGENGPVAAFLAGDVPGGFDGKVRIRATLSDANIINPVCGATIAALVNSMRNGLTYVNVHSQANPSGEVRGQIKSDDHH